MALPMKPPTNNEVNERFVFSYNRTSTNTDNAHDNIPTSIKGAFRIMTVDMEKDNAEMRLGRTKRVCLEKRVCITTIVNIMMVVMTHIVPTEEVGSILPLT